MSNAPSGSLCASTSMCSQREYISICPRARRAVACPRRIRSAAGMCGVWKSHPSALASSTVRSDPSSFCSSRIRHSQRSTSLWTNDSETGSFASVKSRKTAQYAWPQSEADRFSYAVSSSPSSSPTDTSCRRNAMIRWTASFSVGSRVPTTHLLLPPKPLPSLRPSRTRAATRQRPSHTGEPATHMWSTSVAAQGLRGRCGTDQTREPRSTLARAGAAVTGSRPSLLAGPQRWAARPRATDRVSAGAAVGPRLGLGPFSPPSRPTRVSGSGSPREPLT